MVLHEAPARVGLGVRIPPETKAPAGAAEELSADRPPKARARGTALLAAAAIAAAILIGLLLAAPGPRAPEQGNAGNATMGCPALYHLQNIRPSDFEGRMWSIAILEPSETGPELLGAALRSSGLVLAYINAGYAEEWRSYWPRLESEGVVHGPSGYPGEYLVEVWSPEWRRTIVSMAVSMVEKGYQGVYLDNIDAVEELEGQPWAQGVNASEAMIRLVCLVRQALQEHGGAALYINIGGATWLLRDQELLGCIDGVLREELWTAWASNGTVPQDPSETARAIADLDYALSHGKTVIVVDPAESKPQAERFCEKAHRHGYIPSPQPAWSPDYSEPPPRDWCPCAKH